MKTLTPIGKSEMLSINGYVNRINKVAKCVFISIAYTKLAGQISAIFTINGNAKAYDNEETAIAFLDGIYFWASDAEN